MTAPLEPAAPGRRHRGRTVVSVVLAVFGCLLALVATVGLWADRNFLDTTRFVSRTAPTVETEEVQVALSDLVTEQVMVLVDPEALFLQAFEDRPVAARLLAAPLADAVEGFVHDRTDQLVASDDFAVLWATALERAHGAAVAVLEGESAAVETTDGSVTLDLIPVVRAVLTRIADSAPDLLGGDRDLSSLEEPLLSEDAKASIEQALGRELPDDFGQIVVYDDGRLAALQDAVDLFQRLAVVAAVLAVLALVASVLLARSWRRRTLQVLLGLAFLYVVLRRAVLRLEEELAEVGEAETNAAAVSVIVEEFTTPLVEFAGWAALVLALAALVLAVTGPYRWAVRTRQVARTAVGATSGDATRSWVGDHADAVQLGLVALGVLVLWVADLDWWAIALLLALIAMAVAAVGRVAAATNARHEEGEPGGPATPAPATPVP